MYSSKNLKKGRSWHNANEETHFLTWCHSGVKSNDPILGGHLDCWTFTERWLLCGMDSKLMEQSLAFEEILHSQLNANRHHVRILCWTNRGNNIGWYYIKLPGRSRANGALMGGRLNFYGVRYHAHHYTTGTLLYHSVPYHTRPY